MRKFALIMVWLFTFLMAIGSIAPRIYEVSDHWVWWVLLISFILASEVAWCIHFFWKDAQYAIRYDRRDSGICIHCAYDCAGLPTPICPECGKPHADHADAGPTSLPESNA